MITILKSSLLPFLAPIPLVDLDSAKVELSSDCVLLFSRPSSFQLKVSFQDSNLGLIKPLDRFSYFFNAICSLGTSSLVRLGSLYSNSVSGKGLVTAALKRLTSPD